MAINYTATSAITARITTTDDDTDALREEEVTLLAFGWADAQPETTTGVWVLGAATGGVTFIPAGAITGLRPCPSNVESALIGIKEEAAEAHRVASDLQLRFDQVIPQVRAAAGLAVGAMETAAEAKEEVEEVAADVEKVEERPAAATRQKQADRPEADAVPASVARQRTRAKASASKATRGGSTRRDTKNRPRQTVG